MDESEVKPAVAPTNEAEKPPSDIAQAQPLGLTEEKFVKCRACRKKIPADATLCVHCKTYQSKFKSGALYLASILAVIVAAASFFVWGISNLPKAYHAMFPRDDVQIVSCNSTEGVVFANKGDGEVFITHIVLKMAGKRSILARREIIEKSLTPGQFLQKKFTVDLFPVFDFVYELSDSQRAAVMQDALYQKKCYKIHFFSANDPAFQDYKQISVPPLLTLPAEGYFVYHGIKSGRVIQTSFPTVGILIKNKDTSCQ